MARLNQQNELHRRLLRSGERPYPLSETVELMAVVMAGLRSRQEAGRFVKLEEIQTELERL